MGKREGFGEFVVKPQGNGYSAGHLRDFNRVREAITKMIR